MAKLNVSLAPSVVGTWSMVKAFDVGDDPAHPTQVTYPWGQNPLGYWFFDAKGNFSLMISQGPALGIPSDPFTGAPQPGWLNPAAPWTVPYDLLIETFASSNPYAYFGTYKLVMDPGSTTIGTLNLQVTFDILRVYTGTLQQRPVNLSTPNFMNIGVQHDPLQQGDYMRLLQKIG